MRNYTYDVFGNKTTMMTYRNESIGPDSGDVTTWLYDEASGSMTNKVYADGKGPTYSYTPDGKLSRRVWARGIITEYTYDDWNNLISTTYSDGTPTIALVYNALGRQTEAQDAAGITTFLYDSFGSLTNKIVSGVAGTNEIERFYDTFGRDEGYALNATRQTTLAYDPATGRLATMLAAGSETPFTWNYLADSDLKSSLAYPNGLTASWQYDANNQLLQVCNASPTNTISQYDYTYDAAGRRVQMTRSGSAMSENRIDAYGYNARSELISASKLGGSQSSATEYAYFYDDIGNRETSFECGTNSVYTANLLNQYTEISDSALSPLLGHPLRGQPSAGGYSSPRETFTPTYDDDGNQTLIKTATGIWSVTYNGENRPIIWENVSTNSLTPNSTTPPLISMSYDRMGRRVTKNNQRFVYDRYLCIKKIEDPTAIHYSLSLIHYFVWDPTEPFATRPLVWNSDNSTSFYTHDGNKNVSDLTDISQSISAHYSYTPFGALLSSSGSSALSNSLRFSSEYADDDLGLIYYNYRYYNSLNGRWLSRDPIEEAGSINLYLFCKNMTIQIHDFIGLVFNKALCLALQQEVNKLVDALNHELEKYDPVLDGRGGFPYRHGKSEGVTKPGGHYEEIRNLQKGIKKQLKKWKDVCSGGPPSCPPIKYPIWADQLSNQHIAEPVYNDGTENSNQTVPVIDVDIGGLRDAIIDGMIAGVIIAAMAGNAGPQALVPEEIVTVPASAVVGAIVGVVGFVTN